MSSSMNVTSKPQKVSYFSSEDNWLFSPSTYLFPNPNSVSNPIINSDSKINSNLNSKQNLYRTANTEDEIHMFDSNYDVNQPLFGTRKRSIYLSFHYLVIYSIIVTLIVSGSVMTMVPCATGEGINSVFKFHDTNSGIPFLPGQSEQELLYQNKIFNIALLGDSLINKPYNMFDLSGKIQAYLPGYKLNLVNCGNNGARVGKEITLLSTELFFLCLLITLYLFLSFILFFSF